MSNFHGYNKKKNYFEGWYFKNQCDNDTVAFIPGVSIGMDGNKFSFIQIITSTESYSFKYSYSEFVVTEHKLYIEVGKNKFSEDGVEISIHKDDIDIEGKLEYGPFTKLDYDIMGPFKNIPFMECHHEIISMNHSVKGKLVINGREIIFKDSIGYIEKDWGKSFPENYLWVQCNDFKGSVSSIMVSIADIPFFGLKFKGCISAIYHNGMKYRMATYNRVKILRADSEAVILEKGNERLEIDIKSGKGMRLKAPVNGYMTRLIREHPSCKADFRFYINGKLEFSLKSDNCSFEYVNKK